MQLFKRSFPKVEIDDKETYVLQMFANMQGTKNASRDFNILITKIFATIRLYPTSVGSGIYVMSKNNKILILAIQTDDLLIATEDDSLKDLVISTLRQAFQVTSQDGTMLKFLNFCIIQSPHGMKCPKNTFRQELILKRRIPHFVPIDSFVKRYTTQYQQHHLNWKLLRKNLDLSTEQYMEN